MKIYANANLQSIIDKCCGKDFWLLVKLGSYRRLSDDMEFNDDFTEYYWVNFAYKGRQDSSLAGCYFFYLIQDGTNAANGACRFKISPIGLDRIYDFEFYTSPENIQVVTPVEMYTSAEFFCQED